MKNYYSSIKAPKKSDGFTLIELLVALVITSIVITIAGSGLVSIMTANKKAEGETERRVNLNRALDFIADEIRMSNSVSSATNGVIHLTIPSDTTNPNRIYYIGDSNSNWVGPKTIFRVTGTLSNTALVSGGTMLVDGITAPASTPSCSTTLLGNNGFYACINGRIVELYLYGKLTDAYGNQTGTYEAKTKAFARSGT